MDGTETAVQAGRRQVRPEHSGGPAPDLWSPFTPRTVLESDSAEERKGYNPRRIWLLMKHPKSLALTWQLRLVL